MFLFSFIFEIANRKMDNPLYTDKHMYTHSFDKRYTDAHTHMRTYTYIYSCVQIINNDLFL